MIISVDRYVKEQMGLRRRPTTKGAPVHRFTHPRNPRGGRGMKVADVLAGLYLAGKGLPWE